MTPQRPSTRTLGWWESAKGLLQVKTKLVEKGMEWEAVVLKLWILLLYEIRRGA